MRGVALARMTGGSRATIRGGAAADDADPVRTTLLIRISPSRSACPAADDGGAESGARLDQGPRPAQAGRPTPARRSGSGTSVATWRSPASCGPGTRTCRSTGSPSPRSPERWRSTAQRATGVPLPGEQSSHIECEAGEHDLHVLPGAAPDGRDPGGELHGLPRPGPRRAVRPVGRRRGLGYRLLPAREPGAEAGPVRLDDRLRRLAADARRGAARGGRSPPTTTRR